MRRFLLLLLLITLAACSQGPTLDQEVLPDLPPVAFGPGKVTDLAKHSSGVYIVGQVSADAFIRKYDAGGRMSWGKQFGVRVREYTRMRVASDSSNNAYVVGSAIGSAGTDDFLLRKYTPGGAVAWTRRFGRAGYSHPASGVAVFGDSIYVAWRTYEDSGDLDGGLGLYDIYGFLRKYDKTGKIIWTRKIGTPDPFPDVDVPVDVAMDAGGNVYVVGSTNGSLTGANGGGSDMFIRKYSSGGSVLWTRQHHNSDYNYAEHLAVSGNHVYIVIEFLKGDNGDAGSGIRVVKYTAGGSLVWNKRYGTYGTNLVVTDASADSKGNLYVAGSVYTSSTEYGSVIKLNARGGYAWERLFDTFSPSTVLSRTDSQVYIGGSGLMRLRSSDGRTVWASR